ncbi:hypothetical protein [Reyranella sp.]|uniref:hypothetical protein n=1 Tax=Reyranella sp. TaxID=1929291 RepID=UPI003BA97145
MSTLASTRRGFLLSATLLPLAACATTPSPQHTLSPRGDRLVALIQRTGRDNMTAPEAFALMGITNQGRDIPVRQLADDGPDGRYVVNLVNIRQYHEFVFQRRQGDVLILHSADTAFKRLVSVRYARNGKPTVIADTAFAERDFQQQTAFWFDRIPGR